MVKDLELKLNCLIQNKDLYEQVLSRNQSIDDSELMLRLKHEIEKKDIELRNAKGKIEYYMKELYSFMTNLSNIRHTFKQIEIYYNEMNNFMKNIKTELSGYRSKVNNMTNESYSIQSTKIILSREIDQLSIHIDEKKIQLNE